MPIPYLDMLDLMSKNPEWRNIGKYMRCPLCAARCDIYSNGKRKVMGKHPAHGAVYASRNGWCDMSRKTIGFV